jgi:hypothetical protein
VAADVVAAIAAGDKVQRVGVDVGAIGVFQE